MSKVYTYEVKEEGGWIITRLYKNGERIVKTKSNFYTVAETEKKMRKTVKRMNMDTKGNFQSWNNKRSK